MTVPAPEIQAHLNAGEKAAPQEVVDFMKSKGVASLKVLSLTCLNKTGLANTWPVQYLCFLIHTCSAPE